MGVNILYNITLYMKHKQFLGFLFQSIQKYMMNTNTTTAPAAAFMYIDFMFKYVASFLYF